MDNRKKERSEEGEEEEEEAGETKEGMTPDGVYE